jgi:hypothetical protein
MTRIIHADNHLAGVAKAALLLIFVFQTGFAGATDAICPRWASEDLPKLDHSFDYIDSNGHFVGQGPSFETKSHYWQRGVWFEMPFGYRNPWLLPEFARIATNKRLYSEWLGSSGKGFDPKTEQFNPQLISNNGIDGLFAFWMPDGRYVERNRWKTAHFRPCEAGRPTPNQNEYVVVFQIEWPFLPGSKSSKPARRFRNAERDLLEKGRIWSQEASRAEHSLNGPISGKNDYHIYSDDGDLVAMFFCTELWNGKPAPNPTCAGHIWQQSMDLILYLQFPSDQGQRGHEELWREPVSTAISLSSEWKVDDPLR